MNMLHIILKNGRVIEVIELAERYGDPDRYLAEEFDYKVEYFNTCTHKTDEEHDAECWRR